jgi:hypothetical protein
MGIKRDPSKFKTLDSWLDEENIREEVTATAKAIIGLAVEQKQGRGKRSDKATPPITDHAAITKAKGEA